MYRLMPFTRRALAAAAALSCVLATPRVSLAQAACAAGDATIRAGDARFARFHPIAFDSIEMSMEREGATRAFGTYTQHVERTALNGSPALLFVQRGSTPRGTALDSVWVDARTWAPLRHWADTPGKSFDVSFRGGRVTGRQTSGDTVRAIDRTLPAGMLDFSVTNAALAAIPHCAGRVITMTGYDPAMDTVRTTLHRVAGAERVEIGGAPRDVWATDAEVDGRTVRIHVDRATGRELQWSFGGPNGVTVRGVSRIFDTR